MFYQIMDQQKFIFPTQPQQLLLNKSQLKLYASSLDHCITIALSNQSSALKNKERQILRRLATGKLISKIQESSNLKLFKEREHALEGEIKKWDDFKLYFESMQAKFSSSIENQRKLNAKKKQQIITKKMQLKDLLRNSLQKLDTITMTSQSVLVGEPKARRGYTESCLPSICRKRKINNARQATQPSNREGKDQFGGSKLKLSNLLRWYGGLKNRHNNSQIFSPANLDKLIKYVS